MTRPRRRYAKRRSWCRIARLEWPRAYAAACWQDGRCKPRCMKRRRCAARSGGCSLSGATTWYTSLARMAGCVEETALLPRVIDFVDALSLNFQRRSGYDRAPFGIAARLEARRRVAFGDEGAEKRARPIETALRAVALEFRNESRNQCEAYNGRADPGRPDRFNSVQFNPARLHPIRLSSTHSRSSAGAPSRRQPRPAASSSGTASAGSWSGDRPRAATDPVSKIAAMIRTSARSGSGRRPHRRRSPSSSVANAASAASPAGIPASASA